MTDAKKICCIEDKLSSVVSRVDSVEANSLLVSAVETNMTAGSPTVSPTSPGDGYVLVSSTVHTADSNSRSIKKVNSNNTITLSGNAGTGGVVASVWVKIS